MSQLVGPPLVHPVSGAPSTKAWLRSALRMHPGQAKRAVATAAASHADPAGPLVPITDTHTDTHTGSGTGTDEGVDAAPGGAGCCCGERAGVGPVAGGVGGGGDLG